MDKKSKNTAGLLAIFIGGIGIHHYYLGNKGLFMIYLLIAFFTGGVVTAIIGLLEGLVFLSQSQEEFDKKYNKS